MQHRSTSTNRAGHPQNPASQCHIHPWRPPHKMKNSTILITLQAVWLAVHSQVLPARLDAPCRIFGGLWVRNLPQPAATPCWTRTGAARSHAWRLWYPCSLTRCTGVFLSCPLSYLPPLLVLQIRCSGPEDRTSLVVFALPPLLHPNSHWQSWYIHLGPESKMTK